MKDLMQSDSVHAFIRVSQPTLAGIQYIFKEFVSVLLD